MKVKEIVQLSSGCEREKSGENVIGRLLAKS